MPMMHYSGRPYEVEAAHASAVTRERFENLLSRGREKLPSLLQHMHANQPRDRLVDPRAFDFEYDADRKQVVSRIDGQLFDNHRNGWGHMVTQSGLLQMGTANNFIKKVENDQHWAGELLAHNMNQIFKNHLKERLLMRTVVREDGSEEIRAVLSSKYKIWDSAELLDTFIQTVHSMGAVPIDTHFSDTKWVLKVALQTIYEPIKNEVMMYGLVLGNSDFGNGAMSLRSFLVRLACTNLMTAEEALKKVHIGREMVDSHMLSGETIKAQTKAMKLELRDRTSHLLEAPHVDDFFAKIQQANEESLGEEDVKDILGRFRRRGKITAGEEVALQNEFSSEKNTTAELLPPASNLWRLSNAFSLFAQEKDSDRRLEMERLATEVLN